MNETIRGVGNLKIISKWGMLSALYFLGALIITGCHKGEGEYDHDHDEEALETHENIETHEDHGITLSSEMADEFGVMEEAVTLGKFHHVIKVSGKVESSASDIHTITAKQNGILTLSSDITPGINVSAGQRIGNITSEGVQGGDLNRAAQGNFEVAKNEYERLKPLYEDGLVTASVFREAERAYKEAQALTGNMRGGTSALIAPATGIIRNLYATSGQYVDVGAPVAVISKNSNLTLRADLPARYSSHLAEITTANFIPEGSDEAVKLTDLNGRKLSGTTGGAENGYLPIYFTFTGNPLSYPGGFAEVFLICGEREGVISVPKEALIEIQGNKYVYVDDHGHGYEKKLVKTGASDGQRIEILDGIEPGDRIVSKGASVVRMAEISAIAPPAHNHNH